MTPARRPRNRTLDARLLVIEPSLGTFHDARVGDLKDRLRRGDLLVVNDASTLPASFDGVSPSGRPIELRLAAELGDGSWNAVLFGEGDWRTPTEHRPKPEALAPGASLALAHGLAATVLRVSTLSHRLVVVRFNCEGDVLWRALYRAGRPVQYSYIAEPLELEDVQTSYGSRPWAVELPSAGRPLGSRLFIDLAGNGVCTAALTHAAGLSSTGDEELDAALPFPERFEIPPATVGAVREAHASGGRVIAVGTTVVRALEGNAALHDGVLEAGSGLTDLVIRPGFKPRIVDGILSGLHEPATSHHELLQAFAPPGLLLAAYEHAEAAGYLHHEFGDSCLILPGPQQAASPPLG